jgi:hypothetical protein
MALHFFPHQALDVTPLCGFQLFFYIKNLLIAPRAQARQNSGPALAMRAEALFCLDFLLRFAAMAK